MTDTVNVPREPTRKMVMRGSSACEYELGPAKIKATYRSMLAAAPKAEPVPCVSCEGRPAPENNPCHSCGAEAPKVEQELVVWMCETSEIGVEALFQNKPEDWNGGDHATPPYTHPAPASDEQEPVGCHACYRGEVFGLSTDDGFWVEMGWSSGGANPAGLNGEIQLIEHHPDGKVIERVYVAKDSPTFPAPASDELLETLEKVRLKLSYAGQDACGEAAAQSNRNQAYHIICDILAKHKGSQS